MKVAFKTDRLIHASKTIFNCKNVEAYTNVLISQLFDGFNYNNVLHHGYESMYETQTRQNV